MQVYIEIKAPVIKAIHLPAFVGLSSKLLCMAWQHVKTKFKSSACNVCYYFSMVPQCFCLINVSVSDLRKRNA